MYTYWIFGISFGTIIFTEMLAGSFYSAAEIGDRSNKQVIRIFYVRKYNPWKMMANNRLKCWPDFKKRDQFQLTTEKLYVLQMWTLQGLYRTTQYNSQCNSPWTIKPLNSEGKQLMFFKKEHTLQSYLQTSGLSLLMISQ